MPRARFWLSWALALALALLGWGMESGIECCACGWSGFLVSEVSRRFWFLVSGGFVLRCLVGCHRDEGSGLMVMVMSRP
ncbi:uncharacterized protein BO95DRAFT_447080 [Aspergillus brunneoviolaceus CBS 621.78]|uniref:Uncharacterized protein n=1 Tax=Aspergillus brunneoviolaceus CBS 621.78 TaxID=1450534 RepID=A0ACD1FWS1_9EURO|nr:hypothetical protein BO95DRAFT_447080 [Aspergillus brunneoviolaceus CBS 621.78]RAH41404.1 hypothetical protein BO95DRAFT_447080 [Aspergillus brunneoviolaceus CBS 621.78]